jgi:hypothetical protein
VRIRDLGTRPAPASIREMFSLMVRGHGPATVVERRQIPYWQERGWARAGRTFTGNYQTAYGAFYGQITEHPGGHIDFWLYMPPDEIRRHSHWVCFQDRGDGWYIVHMARMPKDVGSGIITIERLITEAYES